MSIVGALAAIVRDAGYIADVDDATVSFKSEGTAYRLESFGDDAGYARLIVGFLLPADIPIAVLLDAANEQNRKTKSVKTVLYELSENRQAAFSVEIFFAEPGAWAPIFERSLAAVRHASDEYFAIVNSSGVAAKS
jgi:hypothetical protein